MPADASVLFEKTLPYFPFVERSGGWVSVEPMALPEECVVVAVEIVVVSADVRVDGVDPDVLVMTVVTVESGVVKAGEELSVVVGGDGVFGAGEDGESVVEGVGVTGTGPQGSNALASMIMFGGAGPSFSPQKGNP